MDHIVNSGGTLLLAGSRVSLDSIVYEYLRGESANSIAESFPSVTPEAIEQALVYFREYRAEVLDYLRLRQSEFSRLRSDSLETQQELFDRLKSPLHRA